MLTVKFENPPNNELVTRNFEPGQALRIGIHYEDFPFPNFAPGINVRFEILSDLFKPIFIETVTNVWGDAWVDIILPAVEAKATVRITVPQYLFGAPEILEIPISIGNVRPDPVEPPEAPGGLLGNLDKALNWVPWIAVVVGIVYLAPSIMAEFRRKK